MSRPFRRERTLKNNMGAIAVKIDRLIRKPLIASALLCAMPGAAWAGSQNTPMSVSATVTANCTVSTTSVAFGNVNAVSGSNYDATGTVSVTCTSGSGWSASASVGGGSGATFTTRRMTSGANTLNYTLYTDSGRNTVWGDGTGTTGTLSGTGNGAAQTLTVYGRVPSGQTTVPAGSYADTVSVTVTY
jgi:spore coat protein U-like protein